jgi:hypothetical protein
VDVTRGRSATRTTLTMRRGSECRSSYACRPVAQVTPEVVVFAIKGSREISCGGACRDQLYAALSAHRPSPSSSLRGLGEADYEQAVEAAGRWFAEHGRYPQQREWEHRAHGHPTTRMIKRRWGWDELMRAAAGGPGARSPKLERCRQRRLELLPTSAKLVRSWGVGPRPASGSPRPASTSPGAAACAPLAAGGALAERRRG